MSICGKWMERSDSMVCNEEEVLRICKKYGIETVEKEGYPIYRDKEMDENFSISDIMHEPVQCI